MPILKNRPPEYKKSGKYAVVYHNGKRIYLGLYGSPESHVAYSRFIAESRANPIFYLTKEDTEIAVSELAAAFLDHTKATADSKDYSHCRVVILEFLDRLYGDGTSVDDFKPKSLKLVRDEMIRSRRFCRRTVNRYTHRIVAIFAWGVENELVKETTWRALKTVKSLPEPQRQTGSLLLRFYKSIDIRNLRKPSFRELRIRSQRQPENFRDGQEQPVDKRRQVPLHLRR